MRTNNSLFKSVVLLSSLCITPLLYAQPVDNAYEVVNLVSDIPGNAKETGNDLVNGWGIAFNPDGPVWVADNGTGKSTLYDGDGKKLPLVVTIPAPQGSTDGKPTGIVFFGGQNGFIVGQGDTKAPSRFIFASENGTLTAWAPTVGCDGPCPSTRAIQVAVSSDGAIYKGLALGANGQAYRLYAADFHNNKIDVYDDKFALVTLDDSAFKDPNLPEGYAPFGIQNIGGVIYVTYAKQDDQKEDEIAGPGLGYVDAYSAAGHIIRRVASQGKLNAPWGLAQAPANFGRFSNHLLVGNFGDGTIVAYELVKQPHHHGKYLKQDGQPIKIDGLWGISFGNGLLRQFTNHLFFAAGPEDETHGLYGKIKPVSNND